MKDSGNGTIRQRSLVTLSWHSSPLLQNKKNYISLFPLLLEEPATIYSDCLNTLASYIQRAQWQRKYNGFNLKDVSSCVQPLAYFTLMCAADMTAGRSVISFREKKKKPWWGEECLGQYLYRHHGQNTTFHSRWWQLQASQKDDCTPLHNGKSLEQIGNPVYVSFTCTDIYSVWIIVITFGFLWLLEMV